MFIKRKRTLSLEGHRLLNITYNNPTQRFFSKRKLQFIINRLFGSEYDDKLEESRSRFREGSNKLYSLINFKDNKKISLLINNALSNIVLLILTNGSKICRSKHEVRKNIIYFIDVAKKAFEKQDHQTVFTIMTSIKSFSISRLNIKLRKSDYIFLNKLEEEYGTSKNCYYDHIKKFIENNEDNKELSLPCLMILLIHSRRIKEYSKCYKSMNNISKNAIEEHDRIVNTIDDLIMFYLKKYKNYSPILLKLYSEDPNKNQIIKYMNIESKLDNNINYKLIKISKNIKK
jgi:hypothetical protein